MDLQKKFSFHPSVAIINHECLAIMTIKTYSTLTEVGAHCMMVHGSAESCVESLAKIEFTTKVF